LQNLAIIEKFLSLLFFSHNSSPSLLLQCRRGAIALRDLRARHRESRGSVERRIAVLLVALMQEVAVGSPLMQAVLQFLNPQSARAPKAGEHVFVKLFLDSMQVLTHAWFTPLKIDTQPEDNPAQSFTALPILAVIALQAD
jgi:hypothetical protein